MVGGRKMRVTSYAPNIWITASFAPGWFADALVEARATGDRASRRREILFAACCAESYIVEWVRDSILEHGRPGKHDFARFSEFFYRNERLTLETKWKVIPERLRGAGLISAVPDFGGAHGADWHTFVLYRNGLVHARASRPDGPGQSDREKPFPTNSILSGLRAGWATQVVADRIRRLHAAAGTAVPDWVVDP
jgi:hypothetical protein